MGDCTSECSDLSPASSMMIGSEKKQNAVVSTVFHRGTVLRLEKVERFWREQFDSPSLVATAGPQEIGAVFKF